MNNSFIELDNGYGTVYRFEIVEKLPARFFVWNIPYPGFLPVATDLRPGDPECFSVDTASLKAIEMDPTEAKILIKAAGYGIKNKKAAETAIKRQPKSGYMLRKKKLAEVALPILEKITER